MAARTTKSAAIVAAPATPNVLASAISKALSKPGAVRVITAKMVRGAARDRIERFDKVNNPQRQGHLYDAGEIAFLSDLFAKRVGYVQTSAPVAKYGAKVAKPRAKVAKVAKVAKPAATPQP